jgi:pimeloyl-ACP methyl ester carboxylesterase
VKLHYLDWGGDGKPMLWLAGLGCSAYIFIEIALWFTDQFRVLALTRRGHGQSDKPESGYDIDTLAEDVHQFIQAMEFRCVTLVGHSFAGDELTRLATLHPEIIEQLVYLDAAYDYGLPGIEPSEPVQKEIGPSEAERSSFDAYRAWFQKWLGFWSEAQEADFLDGYSPSQDGKPIANMPEYVPKAVWEAKWQRDYQPIVAPALAIYADQRDYHEGLLANFDASVQEDASRYFAQLHEHYYQNSVRKFRKEILHGHIVELANTHHMCFVHRPEEVVAAMRTFLGRNEGDG